MNFLLLPLSLSFLFLAALFSSHSAEAAVAVGGAGGAGVILGNSCQDLGATAMSDDHTQILLCAFTSPNSATSCAAGGGCKWVSIGGSNVPTGSSCGLYKGPGAIGSTALCNSITNIPCNGNKIANLSFYMNSPMGQTCKLNSLSCPSGYSLQKLSDFCLFGAEYSNPFENNLIYTYNCYESAYTCIKN